jgi:hypothetical protein
VVKAWQLLAFFDPENKDGYVLARKFALRLKGIWGRHVHQFGFVDLAEGLESR